MPNASSFAFIVLLRDGGLDVYPSCSTCPPGSHPVALVDIERGTWTGYIPYPHRLEDVDALAAAALKWETGNDGCEAYRDKAVEEIADTSPPPVSREVVDGARDDEAHS